MKPNQRGEVLTERKGAIFTEGFGGSKIPEGVTGTRFFLGHLRYSLGGGFKYVLFSPLFWEGSRIACV